MKLGQVKWSGGITAAIFENGTARPIPDYTVIDLIARAEKEGDELSELASGLASRHPIAAEPIIPLTPREVWAAGSTFQVAAVGKDAGCGPGSGFHAEANRGPRPELVFKGTGRICVGPGQCIGIRPDSAFTVPAPELALVLGANGHVLGYTLANDITARDLEYANPLFVGQAKSYTASCALGPMIVTADEMLEPHALEMSIEIRRGGEPLFSAHFSTNELASKLDLILDHLMRANPVPAGSVLLTGSGILVSEKGSLSEGDSVTIRANELGELTNTATMVSYSSSNSSKRAAVSAA